MLASDVLLTPAVDLRRITVTDNFYEACNVADIFALAKDLQDDPM